MLEHDSEDSMFIGVKPGYRKCENEGCEESVYCSTWADVMKGICFSCEYEEDKLAKLNLKIKNDV
jgi:hypothetical protein